MNPVAVAHGTSSAPDGVLVQEAAAGGGASYAALYDRYAQQVYNYCLRLTGSPEDAADATQDAFVNVLARLHKDDNPVLDFSSYLFAAARNESYALMRRRSRTHPSEEPPERRLRDPDVETDPERAVLLADSQESVRVANAQLAPRHREVLALREVAGRSYEEIGEIMGISENAAAQLIWRARAKMKGALTAGAVASVIATTEDCETAQVLINRLQDGESITDEQHEWLDDHLEHCAKCRAARGMIFEVATSYRVWAPVAVLATMKADVLAAAGDVVGADWTSAHLAGGGSGASGGGAHASGAHGAGRFAKRPRGAQAAAGAAVTAGIMAAIGLVVAGIGNEDAGVKPAGTPAERSAPAKQAEKEPKAKAAAAGTPSTALGIHSVPRVIPGQVLGLTQAPANTPKPGAPGERGGPKDEPGNPNGPGGGNPGDPPNGGNPGNPPNGGNPGNPPGGGNPGNPPGGGSPGNPPGGNPGNPSPGNPPGGNPGNPPGGGPSNPPGGDPGGNPGGQTPPPATGGDCSWPGQGGGPGGCPPGHGGIPPGQGGTPPGQGKKP